MYGSHLFVTTYPWWVVFAVLYFLVIGILPIIRRIFEGQTYNNCLSSEYGDVALILVIMIGVDVLRRTEHVDGFVGTINFHNIIGFAVVVVGIVWQLATMEKEK